MVAVDADHEIEGSEGSAPKFRIRPGGDDGASQHHKGADRIRLSLQHRLGEDRGVRLAPIGAVKREAVPPQRLSHVGIGHQAAAVLREDILFHP